MQYGSLQYSDMKTYKPIKSKQKASILPVRHAVFSFQYLLALTPVQSTHAGFMAPHWSSLFAAFWLRRATEGFWEFSYTCEQSSKKPTACSPMVMTLWVNRMAIGLKVGLNMKANHSGVDYKEGLKKQNKTPSKIKQAHTRSMENGCCRQFWLLFLTLSFTLIQRSFLGQKMTSALSVVCGKVSATTQEQPTSWVQGSLWYTVTTRRHWSAKLC